MDDIQKKMDNALVHFEKELNTLRTSRASPNMLDNINVDAYGSKTPLNQLGNISIPDPNTITIQIWDSSLVKQIENAITLIFDVIFLRSCLLSLSICTFPR